MTHLADEFDRLPSEYLAQLYGALTHARAAGVCDHAEPNLIPDMQLAVSRAWAKRNAGRLSVIPGYGTHAITGGADAPSARVIAFPGSR